MDWIKEIVAEKDSYKKFLLYEKALMDISNTPNLVPEASKALIEAICKTILNDLGNEFDKKWNIQKLVRETFNSLKILKLLEVKDKNRAKQIIGSFQNIIQNLAELRNDYGFLSHGSDVELNDIDSLIAELCRKSSDVIGGFLLKSHISFSKINDLDRLRYEEYKSFNEWFDNQQDLSLKIANAKTSYSASEALFYLDRKAYKEELLDYDEDNNQND
jgi:hypothetical protein